MYIVTNSMACGTRRFNAHSQGFSNIPYPEPNQFNFPYWHLFFKALFYCCVLKVYFLWIKPSNLLTKWLTKPTKNKQNKPKKNPLRATAFNPMIGKFDFLLNIT